MIGTWHALVVDCPDPRALAAFYEELLGLRRIEDDADWVSIGRSPEAPDVAFQLAPALAAPRWPDPGFPQQMHFDVRVDDLDAGEEQVLSLGATKLPGGGRTFRVYADPAGHPFCLVTD
jgi:catechol 2,3-dioxygenase-like lactoylglutathione lyase family enzyme